MEKLSCPVSGQHAMFNIYGQQCLFCIVLVWCYWCYSNCFLHLCVLSPPSCCLPLFLHWISSCSSGRGWCSTHLPWIILEEQGCQRCLLVTNLFAPKRRYSKYKRAGIFPFFPRYFAKTAQDMFCEPLTPKSFWKQRQSICTNSKPAGSSG